MKVTSESALFHLRALALILLCVLAASDCWAVGYYVSASGVSQTPTERLTLQSATTCPGSQVADATGDAANNFIGGDGTNMDNLDLISASFGLDETQQNLLVTLTLNNLHSAPPPLNINEIYWSVYWDYNGTTYYAQAVANAPNIRNPGQPPYQYFQGIVNAQGARERRSEITGAFNPGPGGTIVIKVPLVSVGSPAMGSILTNTYADDNGLVITPISDTYYLDAADRAPDAGYGAAYVVGQSCLPVPLISVVSKKVHGTVGTFDVDLPFTGNSGIECRGGGANSDHTLIFSFANPLVSVGGASVTGGSGMVSSSGSNGSNLREYIVNLTGVTNAQTITVSLTNVSDSAGNNSASLSASMGVLLGDVNQTKIVDGNDVSAVQGNTRQPVSASTFRYDINVSGIIDGNDVSTTQVKTRTRLP